MKGYKAFDKGMVCRGKQYQENIIAEELGTIELCGNGIHFCEKPLDVLNYYSPMSEFASVEALGKVKSNGDKACTNKLQINSKITIFQLFEEHFKEVLKDIAESKETQQTSGYKAHSQTSGYKAHSQTSGNYAHSQTSGDEAISCSIGIQSKAKAVNGWIVITDWRYADKWQIHNIHSAKVGRKIKGIKIQPDTFYWFENGELRFEGDGK